MQTSYIFTIAVNCGKIARVALESFHKHHDRYVNVFGTAADFHAMGEIVNHPHNILIDVGNFPIMQLFKEGHAGTARVFAQALLFKEKYQSLYRPHRMIHFDSDIFFKKESISLIENAFAKGYDLIGSRRCFGNNPSGVPGLEGYNDTISTYFMGINTQKLPEYELEYLTKMCQGVVSPSDKPILDFFDPVSHEIMDHAGEVLYLDSKLIGGQDETGKKENGNPLNMHMDCGDHLIHFGGVGSGLAVYNRDSSPEPSYAKWAIGRYSLWAKLFEGKESLGMDIAPTRYTEDGRWADGNYDQTILNQALKNIYQNY